MRQVPSPPEFRIRRDRRYDVLICYIDGMKFRIGGMPIYSRGEKYCSLCNTVHPPEWKGIFCRFCGQKLRTRPYHVTKERNHKRISVEEAIGQEVLVR